MDSSAEKDIFDILTEMGESLSTEEKQTLRALLRAKEPADAKTIAFSGGKRIQLGKVHVALKSLHTKNLIILTTPKDQRPAKYKILPPDTIKTMLEKAQLRFNQQLNHISLDSLNKYIEQYGTGPTSPDPHFEYLFGRDTFYRKAIEMIKKKPDEVFVISRRGVFYKSILDDVGMASKELDPVEQFGATLRDYFSRGGKLYALVSPILDQIEIVDAVKKKYSHHFYYELIGVDPYKGVSAMTGINQVLLGWNKNADEGTNEGICIDDPKIYEFIKTMFLLRLSPSKI